MKTLFPGLRAANAVNLTLKKVVITKELGMSCDVYLAGEKLGAYVDRANGGGGHFYLTHETRAKLVKVARENNLPTLAPLPEDDPLYVPSGPMNDEEFIDSVVVNLMFETHELKSAKRKCKTNVLVVFSDSAPGDYAAYKLTFDEGSKKAAISKFGDKISFFVNEDILTL